MIQQRTISSPSAAAQPGGKRAILDVADPEYQKRKRGKSVALKSAARPIRRRRAKSAAPKAAPKAARGIKRQPLDFEVRRPIKKSKISDINVNPNLSGGTMNMGGIGGIGGMMGGIGGINGDDNTGAEGFNMAPNFYRTPSTETIIEEQHGGAGDRSDIDDDVQPRGAGVGLDEDDPPTFDEASDADDEESDGDEDAPPAYAPAVQVAAGAPQPPDDDDGDRDDDSSQQDESTQSDGVNRMEAIESSDDEAGPVQSVPVSQAPAPIEPAVSASSVAQPEPMSNAVVVYVANQVEAKDGEDEIELTVDEMVRIFMNFSKRKVANEFSCGDETETSSPVETFFGLGYKEVESNLRQKIIADAQVAEYWLNSIPAQDEMVNYAIEYLWKQGKSAIPGAVFSGLKKGSFMLLKLGRGDDDNFRNGWPGKAYDVVRRQKWIFWILLCIFCASIAHGCYKMYSDGTWPLWSLLLALLSMAGMVFSILEKKNGSLDNLLDKYGKANKPGNDWVLKARNVNGDQFIALLNNCRNLEDIQLTMRVHDICADIDMKNRPSCFCPAKNEVDWTFDPRNVNADQFEPIVSAAHDRNKVRDAMRVHNIRGDLTIYNRPRCACIK